jgi:hypothetical protein
MLMRPWSPICGRQGPNVFCKTNTPEFGAGGNTRNRVYGATGNPFNPEFMADDTETARPVPSWEVLADNTGLRQA